MVPVRRTKVPRPLPGNAHAHAFAAAVAPTSCSTRRSLAGDVSPRVALLELRQSRRADTNDTSVAAATTHQKRAASSFEARVVIKGITRKRVILVALCARV